jgi:hypothetical protein
MRQWGRSGACSPATTSPHGGALPLAAGALPSCRARARARARQRPGRDSQFWCPPGAHRGLLIDRGWWRAGAAAAVAGAQPWFASRVGCPVTLHASAPTAWPRGPTATAARSRRRRRRRSATSSSSSHGHRPVGGSCQQQAQWARAKLLSTRQRCSRLSGPTCRASGSRRRRRRRRPPRRRRRRTLAGGTRTAEEGAVEAAAGIRSGLVIRTRMQGALARCRSSSGSDGGTVTVGGMGSGPLPGMAVVQQPTRSGSGTTAAGVVAGTPQAAAAAAVDRRPPPQPPATWLPMAARRVAAAATTAPWQRRYQ